MWRKEDAQARAVLVRVPWLLSGAALVSLLKSLCSWPIRGLNALLGWGLVSSHGPAESDAEEPLWIIVVPIISCIAPVSVLFVPGELCPVPIIYITYWFFLSTLVNTEDRELEWPRDQICLSIVVLGASWSLIQNPKEMPG